MKKQNEQQQKQPAQTQNQTQTQVQTQQQKKRSMDKTSASTPPLKKMKPDNNDHRVRMSDVFLSEDKRVSHHHDDEDDGD